MTLTHDTLERLIRKEEWLEARWITNTQLGFIEQGDGSVLCILQDDHLQKISPDISIGSTLEPHGYSFISDSQTLFALGKKPLQICEWSLEDLSAAPNLYPLHSPATCLAMDPAARWISWIEREGSGTFLIKSMKRGKLGEISISARLTGVPFGLQWSPKDSYCLALLSPSNQTPWQNAELFLGHYTVETQQPKVISWQSLSPDSTASKHCLEAQFSPDGRYILGLWQTGEWFQLWSYDLHKKTWQQLSFKEGEQALVRKRCDTATFVVGSTPHDVLSIHQERGYHFLSKTTLNNGIVSSIKLEEYTHLKNISMRPDQGAISLIGASSLKPPTLIELRPDECNEWRLHKHHSKGIGAKTFPMHPEMLSWLSVDGTTIYGLLYRDKRHQGPQALLLPIHGGPTEQVSATWPIKAQAFVDQGYAVLYVNYRGSWGYGKTYHESLKGRWAELAASDVVSALHHLSATAWIDPQRVALWGGDIGGSMVINILQRFPKVFRAAITVFPICNFQDYWEKASDLQRAELDWALGTTSIQNRLEQSLLSRADLIQTPLAMFHGELDHLVPLSHLQELKESLTRRKIPVWLTTYPEEGHGWQTRTTLEDYYCKVASFLARHLHNHSLSANQNS